MSKGVNFDEISGVTSILPGIFLRPWEVGTIGMLKLKRQQGINYAIQVGICHVIAKRQPQQTAAYIFSNRAITLFSSKISAHS